MSYDPIYYGIYCSVVLGLLTVWVTSFIKNGFLCSCRIACGVPLTVPMSRAWKHWGHFLWGYTAILAQCLRLSEKWMFLQYPKSVLSLGLLTGYVIYNFIKRVVQGNLHVTSYAGNSNDNFLGILCGLIFWFAQTVFIRLIKPKRTISKPPDNKYHRRFAHTIGLIFALIVWSFAIYGMTQKGASNSSNPCRTCTSSKCDSYNGRIWIPYAGGVFVVLISIIWIVVAYKVERNHKEQFIELDVLKDQNE